MSRFCGILMISPALVGAALAALLPFTAHAQTKLPDGPAFPTWAVATVCAHDSVADQCLLDEMRSEKVVGSTWTMVSADVRERCLADAKVPLAQSWRLLSACLDVGLRRTFDRLAVMTAKTPSEPVPPKKVVPIAAPPAETPPKAAEPAADAPVSPPPAAPPAAAMPPVEEKK